MSIGATITAHASAARTATGQTAAFDVPVGSARIALLANVTAVSGTAPSMTLSIEWSNDGTTFAQGDPADAMTAITAASTKAKDFQAKGSQFRLVYTISGTTPSFTFVATVSGQRA